MAMLGFGAGFDFSDESGYRYLAKFYLRSWNVS